MTDYDWRAHDDRAAQKSDAYNEAASEIRIPAVRPLVRNPGVEEWSLLDQSSSFLFIEDEGSAHGPWNDPQSLDARLRAGDDEWLRQSTSERSWNGFAWYGQPYRGDQAQRLASTRDNCLGRFVYGVRARPG